MTHTHIALTGQPHYDDGSITLGDGSVITSDDPRALRALAVAAAKYADELDRQQSGTVRRGMRFEEMTYDGTTRVGKVDEVRPNLIVMEWDDRSMTSYPPHVFRACCRPEQGVLGL